MTTETRKRIRAYKRMLPELRERVIAVALLLAMSASMLGSASFAWLTISRRPELTGASTTIAANGNLEIALATSEDAPGESKVGDSSAAEGQSVTAANITWGNLVNLSDDSYGLESMTLRPAQLNRSALTTSPLYGATYGKDGRTDQLSSKFAYATWKPADASIGREEGFQVNDELGVRAITSVTIEAKAFEFQVMKKEDAATTVNSQAGSDYLAITQNRAWMDSLGVVMGTFLTAQLNSENPSMEKKDVQNMRDVFGAFLDVYEMQIQALVNLANYQLFLYNTSEEGSTPYTEYTAETLLSATKFSDGVKLEGLSQLKTDYALLQRNYDSLVALADQATVTYEDMKDICNSLVNVGTCTINGKTVNSLANDKSEAASMVMDNSTKTAVITNGILYNFEALNGARCDVKGLSVPAKYIISVTVKANISTNAPDVSQFSKGLTYARSMNTGAEGEKYAQDTYGMAIDLWVRTNASGNYLILEGNVLTEDEEIYPTIVVDGEELDLYTLDLTSEENGESYTYSIDVYKAKNEAGEEAWFDATSFSEIAEEDMQGNTPKRKVIETEKVVGFEGENRVWDDWRQNDYLSTDSTTQGSGSCYIYYADTPEDQARSLALLKSYKVAFIDSGGTLRATASMDTEHFYAASGRVIVPLKLDVDACINLGEDSFGNVTYAIMPLEKNEPTRITALVYLDGTTLKNQDVLSAADIQGQLNIQFGSSQDMQPVKDEALEAKILRATASVDITEFDYDTATSDMISNVTVTVEGDTPSTVTAFFMREISATQGSREKTITFTSNGAGQWTAQQKFTAPGNYVLRTVQLNGIDYVLSETPRVRVKGFAVESLSCNEADENRNIKIFTANNTGTVNLSLKFVTDEFEKMPKTVQGRFLDEDGKSVNVDFVYNSSGVNQGKWTGSAMFVASGKYTMQYLLLDGKYVELDPSLWQTADVTLGMRVEVYTDSPTQFEFKPNDWDKVEDDNKFNLYMKVKIFDNSGEEMGGLFDVKLYYAMRGATTLEKGLTTPLKWNGSYYTGAFESKVGMFDFAFVRIGEEGEKSNDVPNDGGTAPSFMIYSPVPPKFNSGATEAYQFAPNNNAVMKVKIDECDAAEVYADILKSGESTTRPVAGTLKNGAWQFEVPKDNAGKQDGNWTITQLRLAQVYDENGVLRTTENPLVWSMEGEDAVTTKVVSTVNIVISDLEDTELGKNNNGVVDGAFMQSHSVSGITVDIKDFENQEIPGLDGVALSYTYADNSEVKHGGYSGLTSAALNFEVPMTRSGTKFTQTNAFTVQQAGIYTPTLTYTINGSGYTVAAASKLKLTVYSVAPAVSITAISPTGTFDVDTDSDDANGSHGSATVPDFSATEATVYFKCSRDGSGSTCSPYRHNYSRPSVTITASGLVSGATAELYFGDVHIYDGTTKTTGYRWTGNGVCARNIGYYRSVTASSDTKTPAGTLTANTLSIDYGGNKYTVPVSITIRNPY
ncbi:MAG: hypothetical protein IJN20_01040 [Oscillospiraceae bacterium]|nr:hypothetical protein [Oscillospiraceae bacterium]